MDTVAERVDRLMALAVEETPPPIPDHVMAALPAIFTDLLGQLDAWARGEDVDLPVTLKVCACGSCIVGIAGDRLRQLGYGEEYGFSNTFGPAVRNP
jgi:hypothetical protein